MARLVNLSVLVVLLFATQAFGQGINVKRHVNMNGGVAVGSLTTTEQKGQYPVCFNETGELLPCNSLVEPPPGESQPLDGLWFGAMSTDDENPDCYHGADVVLEISEYSRDDEYVLNRISIELADGRTDNAAVSPEIIRNNFIAAGDYHYPGLFGDNVQFNILFDNYGYAEGSWTGTISGCYGIWSFEKQ